MIITLEPAAEVIAENDVTIIKKETTPVKKAKTKKDLSICPYCNRLSHIIWVHGHYQCQQCKNVIVSCCEQM
jgi:hypothetical protein